MRHFINWGCLAVPPLHPPDKKFVAKAVSAKQRSIFIGKPPPRICRYSRVNCLGLPPPPPCVQNFSNSLLIFLHSCSNQFIIQPTQSTSRRTCHVMVVHESVPSWPPLGVFWKCSSKFCSSFIIYFFANICAIYNVHLCKDHYVICKNRSRTPEQN